MEKITDPSYPNPAPLNFWPKSCDILSLRLGVEKGEKKLCCVVLFEIQREGGNRVGRMRSQKDRRKMKV